MHEQVIDKIDKFLLRSSPRRKIGLLPRYSFLPLQILKKNLLNRLSLLVCSIELALLSILGIKLQSKNLSFKAQSTKEVS